MTVTISVQLTLALQLARVAQLAERNSEEVYIVSSNLIMGKIIALINWVVYSLWGCINNQKLINNLC